MPPIARTLADRVSLELLGTIVVFIFTTGVTYATLSGKQADALSRIDSLEISQVRITEIAQQISTTIAVIRSEQTHLNGRIASQREDLKQIVSLLNSRRLECPPVKWNSQ